MAGVARFVKVRYSWFWLVLAGKEWRGFARCVEMCYGCVGSGSRGEVVSGKFGCGELRRGRAGLLWLGGARFVSVRYGRAGSVRQGKLCLDKVWFVMAGKEWRGGPGTGTFSYGAAGLVRSGKVLLGRLVAVWQEWQGFVRLVRVLSVYVWQVGVC